MLNLFCARIQMCFENKSMCLKFLLKFNICIVVLNWILRSRTISSYYKEYIRHWKEIQTTNLPQHKQVLLFYVLFATSSYV